MGLPLFNFLCLCVWDDDAHETRKASTIIIAIVFIERSTFMC